MNLAFQILAAICTSKAPLLSVREGGKVATGRAGPYFRPQREICRPSRAGPEIMICWAGFTGPGRVLGHTLLLLLLLLQSVYTHGQPCV